MYKIVFLILLFTYNAYAIPNEEFRATWVITWNYISSSSTVQQNKDRIRKILDNHAKANMNAVLFQIRQSGTVYFNSSYEPWGYYAGYRNPGFDPLAFAVEEAHKRGMELHAWFNVFAAASTVAGAPAGEHPEWVCRDGYGNSMPSKRALSPGLPEVREYLQDVAMEVVNNYDVDGLHLDYVRWNEYDRSDFSASDNNLDKIGQETELDGQFSEHKMTTLTNTPDINRYLYDVEHPYSPTPPDGFGTWQDWWRASVTTFVHSLYDSIKTVKPWVRLSVAALGKYRWSGWQGYGVVYQDAGLWFNEGYIDQLTPMHYHWITGDDFYNALASADTTNWEYWIQPGINAGRLFSAGPGSYKLLENNVWLNHEDIINRSREISWVDGFQFFSYGSWRDYDYWEEAGQTVFNRKTRIRAVKHLSQEIPESPEVWIDKIDSLHYQISVGPPEGITKDQWFALYRSADQNLNTEIDTILTIKFGSDLFTQDDIFTGFQDYNSEYTYYATMLNRYWNESGISNTALSEPIPSSAPVVVAAVPSNGDTIPVNSTPFVKFSKKMNPSSVQDNISLMPEMDIQSVSWSDGNKNLKIYPADTFEYATSYQLTLSGDITDINGKKLDGNGDRIPGDPVTISFFTASKDTLGPVLLSCFPYKNNPNDNFDVNNVLTFIFDDIVDDETVNENTIKISQNDESVNLNTMVFNHKGKSIVSVQPVTPFDPGKDYAIELTEAISDTFGNAMDSSVQISFTTEPYEYSKILLIDAMTGNGNWRVPGYSNSTNGIDETATNFTVVTDNYLPATLWPWEKKSTRLQYRWKSSALNPPGSDYLIREYLDDSIPRTITFDTTYVLQVYLFGDGSGNQFRFALDEGNDGIWTNHEVCNWIAIDWIGWKMVEWDLGDPETVGAWGGLGNSVLDQSKYRIDSYQLTHPDGSAVSGEIYFKNLRIIQKQFIAVGVENKTELKPSSITLYQNYPNPFNPSTTIRFFIPHSSETALTIYSLLGQKVMTPVNSYLTAGEYAVRINATSLPTGVYYYELRTGQNFLRKRMILIK